MGNTRWYMRNVSFLELLAYPLLNRGASNLTRCCRQWDWRSYRP